jgi:hypothetical protein
MNSTAVFKCSEHGVWPGWLIKFTPKRAMHFLVPSTRFVPCEAAYRERQAP